MTLVDKIRLLLLFLPLLIQSCDFTEKEEVGSSYYEINGSSQGTTFSIVYQDTLSRDFSSNIDSLLKEIDNQLSTYDSNSFISQFNNSNKNKRCYSHGISRRFKIIKIFLKNVHYPASKRWTSSESYHI